LVLENASTILYQKVQLPAYTDPSPPPPAFNHLDFHIQMVAFDWIKQSSDVTQTISPPVVEVGIPEETPVN
jgi:hypothetical protein